MEQLPLPSLTHMRTVTDLFSLTDCLTHRLADLLTALLIGWLTYSLHRLTGSHFSLTSLLTCLLAYSLADSLSD